MDENGDLIFTWKWCTVCQTMMVICPNCGNNCCNAGIGYLDENQDVLESQYTINDDGDRVENPKAKKCSICNLAYQYQHHCWKTRTVPDPEPSDDEKKTLREAYDKAWEDLLD